MVKIVLRPAITTILLATAIAGAMPAHVHAAEDRRVGFAAHYRPGLMERVARVRGLEIVACMVASPHHRIGTWLSIDSPKRKRTLACRVTDVPKANHRAALIKRKIVAELDFESAKILCGITRPRERPPTQCPVVVTLVKRP